MPKQGQRRQPRKERRYYRNPRDTGPATLEENETPNQPRYPGGQTRGALNPREPDNDQSVQPTGRSEDHDSPLDHGKSTILPPLRSETRRDSKCSSSNDCSVPASQDPPEMSEKEMLDNHLTDLAQRFMNQERGHWTKFCKANDDIWQEEVDQYKDAALSLFKFKKPRTAERCVERLVILKRCYPLKLAESLAYLHGLDKSNNSSDTATLKSDCEEVSKALKQVAEKHPQSEQNTLPSHKSGVNLGTPGTDVTSVNHQPEHSFDSVSPVPTSLLGVGATSMNAGGDNRSNALTDVTSLHTPLTTMSIRGFSKHNYEVVSRTSRPSDPKTPANTRPAVTSADSIDELGTIFGAENSGLKAADTDTQSEQLFRKSLDPSTSKALDQSYRLRNGKQFFSKGKVFAMLWHENAGIGGRSNASSNTDPLDRPFNMTKGPFGEMIYSHIRRFIVIRNRHGYCWCIPINSYGDQGLTTKAKVLPLEEIQSHAVVYDYSKEPITYKGESAITKNPIAITVTGKQGLTSTSRLHFGKPYTVEWNIKVMEVGNVHPQSMLDLILYFRDEYPGC